MVDRAMSVAVSMRKVFPSGCPIYNAHPRRGRCAGCQAQVKAGDDPRFSLLAWC
jgi:hypothetical protein